MDITNNMHLRLTEECKWGNGFVMEEFGMIDCNFWYMKYSASAYISLSKTKPSSYHYTD